MIHDNDFYDDYEPYDYEPEPDRMWCTTCDQEVKVIYEDHGIGHYEYWGHKGCDVQLVPICPICEEGIEE